MHKGHQCILKYREKARQALWWLGLSKQLHELISNCAVCSQHRSQKAEPLLLTPLPGLPWERVVTDLFKWKKTTYQLVIDKYSRWIEIARLESMTAECVVNHTSSNFARHGIPKVVISDNGSQYISECYRKFAFSI